MFETRTLSPSLSTSLSSSKR